MRRLTALLNTSNDGLRLGRCLETLHPCDEIVVIDHSSTDNSLRIARQYGARVVTGPEPFQAHGYGAYVRSLLKDAWIFCLDPREALSEGLAASLFEWKSASASSEPAERSVLLREETKRGWEDHPVALTRLVCSTWNTWAGFLPGADGSSPSLEGSLLRFEFP